MANGFATGPLYHLKPTWRGWRQISTRERGRNLLRRTGGRRRIRPDRPRWLRRLRWSRPNRLRRLGLRRVGRRRGWPTRRVGLFSRRLLWRANRDARRGRCGCGWGGGRFLRRQFRFGFRFWFGRFGCRRWRCRSRHRGIGIGLFRRRLVTLHQIRRHAGGGAGHALGEYRRALALEFLFAVEHIGTEKLGRIELAALSAAGDQKRKRKHRRDPEEIAARALRHGVSLSRSPRSARSTFPRGCADPEASADRS